MRNERRKPRVRRISVTLDERTHAELRSRARAHRVSQAAYVRAVICGDRPGGGPNEVAGPADRWWDSLQPDRRAGIFQWITQRRVSDRVDENEQWPLFESTEEPS